jgi:hypothetical protein
MRFWQVARTFSIKALKALAIVKVSATMLSLTSQKSAAGSHLSLCRKTVGFQSAKSCVLWAERT